MNKIIELFKRNEGCQDSIVCNEDVTLYENILVRKSFFEFYVPF